MEKYLIYIAYFILGVSFSGLIFFILFEKIKAAICREFVQVANNAVKTEQENMRNLNREALEEKIKPLTKELTDFRDKVDKFSLLEVENTVKIIEQISVLEKNNKSLELEAKNLTEALTKNQNIKGAYGENILDTVLQNSGLQEGIHYFKQYSKNSENTKDETIHKIRPDIIINLPDNRHLIIDSKVTLTSYLEYIKDNTKLKEFKSEVKKRINDLSEKNYQNADNTNQPDFILMYMPIDSAVSLIYEDGELINLAYKSNIIITGTASLLAAIRLVNQLFAQKKQNENVQKIVNAGTNLYETFVQLSNELILIKNDFEVLSKQFTTVLNRFQRTNKNRPSLFSQIEELKSYGISTAKEIPQELLEEYITND